MWILISAVVTASLLGSMHCVGMCGPLAIWASGASQSRPSRQLALATTLYHFGRLLTYALAGLLAGTAGQLIDIGGQTLGVQLVAARIVGVSMISIGAVSLFRLLRHGLGATRVVQLSAAQPAFIARNLVKLRPYVFRLPVAARGLVTGLLTALLPCGWLYLFALVAAGTGSSSMGPIVMIAFWIGTVPALVGLATGTQALAIRFGKVIPFAAAWLLIFAGCYTVSGRGFARLNSLADIQWQSSTKFSAISSTSAAELARGIEQLTQTPLPCCVDGSASSIEPTPGSSQP